MRHPNPTPETILKNRHLWRLKYFDLWAAIDEDGKEVSVYATVLLSIHDAINLERLRWVSKGVAHKGMDRELMLDFVAVHGAVVIDEAGQQLTFIEA